ncbi:unnamed protein product [marine sediment metagenome]|uniref:Uncharacterized protein n=1 Tax=marine sediment metagenome TaxID=412755 RepID=X1H2A7_9ZZZZ
MSSKKIEAIISNVRLDTDEAPSPTMSMERIRKGLSVRKSNTKATTNVDAACSNGYLSLLFNTYTYEREPILAGNRSTNRLRMNVTNRIFPKLIVLG